MGVIRSAPDTHINIESQSLDECNYVSASVCGWQYYMEDYFGQVQIDKITLFFIIDGHGGP